MTKENEPDDLADVKPKPCPTCGAEGRLHEMKYLGLFYVSCGCPTFFGSPLAAITAWNTRAAPMVKPLERDG